MNARAGRCSGASWPAPKAALAYSGVPKAGEPDFMSTFDVKLPYITGAPGQNELRKRKAGEEFRMGERESAGDRHRGHGARERERSDDQQLSGRRVVHDAVRPRNVELQRRIRIDDGAGRWGAIRTPRASGRSRCAAVQNCPRSGPARARIPSGPCRSASLSRASSRGGAHAPGTSCGSTPPPRTWMTS